MIVIALNSNLGNQMFLYALYLKYKALGIDVLFDIDTFYDTAYPRIDTFFNIQMDIVSEAERNLIKDQGTQLGRRVKRLLFGSKLKRYRDKVDVWSPNILNLKSGYLVGYWQSAKYWLDIDSDIRDAFTFPDSLTEYQKDILVFIRNNISISVHVRRGDYVGNELFEVCTMDYYKNAINTIEQKLGRGVKFFIFSNDIEWCREQFTDKEYCFVVPEKTMPYEKMDMFLMSQCKHNIIANSTFSWWAAYLNSYANKIVIAPKVWLKGKEMRDICPDEWIRI